MEYKSLLPLIWEKLRTEGSIRRPTTSRTTFDNVVAAYQQAETCKLSERSCQEVDMYRAEYNIWGYYFGSETPFPGIDPQSKNESSQDSSMFSAHTTIADTTTTTDSEATVTNTVTSTTSQAAKVMRNTIERMWKGRWNRRNYSPQLGWNPETGEPYMAVRSYAENSYPALSGERHSFLKYVEKQMPEFVVQYERFPHLGYTLIWPEFANPVDLKNQGAWRRFGQFRQFLTEWAAISPKAPHINLAFDTFLNKPESERQGLPFPDGFVLGESGGKRVLGLNSSPGKYPAGDRFEKRSEKGSLRRRDRSLERFGGRGEGGGYFRRERSRSPDFFRSRQKSRSPRRREVESYRPRRDPMRRR